MSGTSLDGLDMALIETGGAFASLFHRAAVRRRGERRGGVLACA
jgi:1,6-anhydro-N-acetylmuramate kinase